MGYSKEILFLLMLFIYAESNAQVLMPLEQDSSQIELERQIEYRQLIAGKPENNSFSDKIDLPDFDLTAEYNKRYTLNLNYFAMKTLPLSNFSNSMFLPVYSPFFANGKVLSEAAYQLGDKFVLGGYSYGMNSILSAPLPANGMNQFDRYGSTLFMQYKISKNFKIETRVNVSQGR